ncbi:MAG: YbhB/YbcL family Raf kinase inhibitor-like protein, partial [Candidatus Binataceae bacterium]
MTKPLARVLLMAAVVQAASACVGHAAAAARISVSLPAISSAGTVPRLYTCDGEDISPAVVWSGTPAEAKTLALIADD